MKPKHKNSPTARARRSVYALVCAALAPTVLVGLFVIWADPYQYFHPSSLFRINMRYMVPGMIKHADYQVIVVGDSMTENFLPSHIEDIMGRPGANLALSGATLHEQATVVQTAIRTGKVKQVIWGLRTTSATGEVDRFRKGRAFPLYLYDANPFNDWRYLYNLDMLKLSVSKTMTPKPQVPQHPDYVNSWFWGKAKQPGRDKILARYQRPATSTDFVPPHYRLEKLTASFDYNLLGAVRANPQVEFIVFMPPYSVLYQLNEKLARPARFDTVVRFYRHVFDRLSGEPNVRLYYFDVDPRITHNLDNYKDTSHYWLNINDLMLRAFAANRYRVTPENKDRLLDMFVQQINSTRLGDILEEAAAADVPGAPPVQ